MATAFENFVNTELPLRPASPAGSAGNYLRITTTGLRGLSERTPAQVLADIAAAAASHSHAHSTLTEIGTNTHAQIDSHIASTSNPHAVTAAQVGALALNGSNSPSANVSWGSNKITSLGTPTADGDAATKAYVDSLANGLDWKASVRVATTAAGTLATDFENGDTIDGVVLATGNRILIKDQAAGAENGIYTVNASGAPTRATDADASAEVTAGMSCLVTEGTANGDKVFILTTNDTITLGTTALTFGQLAGGSYTHPNHTGDVTSVGDGATTIAADAVTNAKAANMAVNTIKGRITAGTGDPEDLTAANVRTIINVADGANNYVHPNHTGDVTSVADGAQTIAAAAVTLAKMANVATSTVFYRKTAATGVPEVQTLATLKTDLGLSGTNTGDQTLPTRASLGLDTTDSPQFAAVNIGHATDTTLTRVSAGVAAIEGSTILVSGGALGTPASGVATNLTGTASGLTAGTVATNANLTGPITSTGNATAIASQTGTGTKFVVDTSPTLVTPVLGVATATTINKVTLTAPATTATLTIAEGKTLTVSNTLTLTATDGSTLAIGAGGTLGSAAYTASSAYEASGGIATHAALTATHGATGAIVGTTNTQTLSAKTITGLILTAGTTTVAPLKLQSGSLLTTPVAGCMEFLTDALSFTITTGAARRTIPFIESTQTWTAAQTFGTTTPIQFRDSLQFVKSDAANNLLVQAQTDLVVKGLSTTTVGVPGDIVLGDSTLRTMYPQTAAKIDLGSAANAFNKLFLESLCSRYNGIATVGNGIPSELATVDLTTQGAAIVATTLYAPTAAGRFRVSFVAKVTRAATTSSLLGGTNGFQVVYTDADDSVVVTTGAITNIAGTTLTGNTTQIAYAGSILVNAKAATNIQYKIDYTSVGATTMQFNLHVKVEAL